MLMYFISPDNSKINGKAVNLSFLPATPPLSLLENSRTTRIFLLKKSDPNFENYFIQPKIIFKNIGNPLLILREMNCWTANRVKIYI